MTIQDQLNEDCLDLMWDLDAKYGRVTYSSLDEYLVEYEDTLEEDEKYEIQELIDNINKLC